MEHAAIDLGRPYSWVCWLKDGIERFHRFHPTRPEFDRLFKEREPMLILFESCTESEWIARHLEGLGHTVVVADPNYEAMYGGRRRGKKKTDKLDARAMFVSSHTGVYRPAHRRSDRGRETARLLGMRDALVRTRTRWVNVCRTQLRAGGHWLTSGTTETFFDRVADLELTSECRGRLKPFEELWEPLNVQIALYEKQIEQLGASDARVRLLQTMPAIGPMRSAAFVAVVDDAHRFRNAHMVESYLGLVPSEWSSSETERKGCITKAGDVRVRWLLVEAAWTILCRPMVGCEELRAWAQRIAERRGKKIAVVALARRIAGILWAMLRDQAAYRPARVRNARPAA